MDPVSQTRGLSILCTFFFLMFLWVWAGGILFRLSRLGVVGSGRQVFIC